MIELNLGGTPVQIDPDDEYEVFEETISGLELADIDFSYLPRTRAIVLANILLRINEVGMIFHPDVVDSIMTERENSIYANKTSHECGVIHRREFSKTDTQQAEERLMLKEINMHDQINRNKKLTVTNNLVKLGYDRSYIMKYLNEYIEENGAGLFNLTAKRISTKIDELIQKEQKRANRKSSN